LSRVSKSPFYGLHGEPNDSGTCTTGILYDLKLPSSSTSIFLSTRILSALLLSLSVLGALCLLFLTYLLLSTYCSSPGSFQAPHRTFLYCFFQPHSTRNHDRDERLERKARFENGLSEGKWEEKDEGEREKMLGQVRMKDCFQAWMFWFVWPAAVCLVGAVWAWKEAVDAEESFAYEL
jgi:hypothetical protein